MKRWIVTAVTLGIAVCAAPSRFAVASCLPKTNGHCLEAPPTISFSSVPDISKEIVSEEPRTEKPVTQTLEAPPISTYTGPMVGVDTMVRAPTVGYYWSLDPDTNTH
jgi:hypothetical protein